MLFVTNIHCTITREDDSQHTLFGRDRERVRACGKIIPKYFTNTHHESTASAASLSAMLKQDSVPALRSPESGAVRPTSTGTPILPRREALRAQTFYVVGITAAGSVLEGAASKAQLSPMHGTRAALELHLGSRMDRHRKKV